MLTNTYPIALIETACKILSKIFSDRILLACNKYDVLYNDNFSVLKGTMTQSPIFAVGSVIEDTIKKNWELWLVMTNFGLTSGYYIFYNPLLCEVKRQKSVCGYKLNSYFISRTGHVESQARLTSFLTAGAFVATQHILDVASKFFRLNDISINNDKTVAISINCQIANLSLLISGMPISVAKKKELYQYLDIFLFTEGLSKPSLTKTHSDVKFFANFVLKKSIFDKQFSYLVSLVLHPIVNYRTQFSFGLKSKSGLSLDFPNDALYHPLLYGLNTFEQIQAEHKVTSVICFANSVGILGHLFAHRSHNLQVLCWHSIHPLSSSTCIGVSASNNFLAGLVHIFHDYNLSLGGIRANAFCLWKGTPMVSVLGDGAAFTWAIFKCWKWLDPCGPVPVWFDLSVFFINIVAFVSITSSAVGRVASQNVLNLIDFATIHNCLLGIGTDSISASTAVFFNGVDLGLGVEVSGLVSFTMVELQAIALALECVFPFSSVHLFFDSQAALDACKSELDLVVPDFRNRCWLEHCHIYDLIHNKNLNICWFKVKGHSGVVGNEHANALTMAATMSEHSLPLRVNACYILVGGVAVSENSRHFVCDIFHCVHCAQWKIGSGFRVLVTSLHDNVDWCRFSLMWHPDMHMAAGSTDKCSVGARTYFIKALYYQLPITVHKHFYSKSYPSILCLYCGEVKVSDHVFFCGSDTAIHTQLLNTHVAIWETLSSLPWSSLQLMQLMLSCEVVLVFRDSKIACQRVVEFVQNFCLAFRDEVWLVRASHHVLIEKHSLIPKDGSVPGLVHGLSSLFFAGVIKMLGIAENFNISFGFHASCLFFSGIGDSVSVIIDA
ncbi:hypothetical protein G9A89_023783 [Geosiphon pyriformis]|nr:hypothetical protein G9A89_023783 [Geosiphon pyriformis]